jgi:cytochrome d ubiquinol oxidase subunit I
MGLIGTRSVSKTIPGIHEIKQKNRERIVNGIQAVIALETLRAHRDDVAARVTLDRTRPIWASACCSRSTWPTCARPRPR